MDGVLVDLLKTKWNAFVKRRFYRQFFLFALYFIISLVCFTLRPGPPDKSISSSNTTIDSESKNNSVKTIIPPTIYTYYNGTFLNATNGSFLENNIAEEELSINGSNERLILQKENSDEKCANGVENQKNKTKICEQIRSNSGGNKDYTPKGNLSCVDIITVILNDLYCRY